MMLKQIFNTLTKKYTDNHQLIDTLWCEIEMHYADSNRYYHSLSHLENMYQVLSLVKEQIEEWDTILFSLFYHDLVYDVTNGDNEERSAEIAKRSLGLISFPEAKIDQCYAQIIATKVHAISDNHDTNLFTDSDLAILGGDWNVYSDYFQNVRKEYSIYSDEVYIQGRINVLNHFLKMESVFKTEYFIDKYEEKAIKNLSVELELLKRRLVLE